ncbi:pyruvate formate-lyase-activating protein [Clostridiaceae bacterium M8S5]|nr:pyruvate formate-lyase-activating protein [Clostridiaceae bacterium M8S5]
MCIKGKIHSIETMGLNDGPGIRCVVFFQGCRLRCAYCHNPDTWDINKGIDMTPQELLNKVLRFKAYFDKSGGGITCSGGEPLLQSKFLISFFKLCKDNNIHTTLDTSGFGTGDYEKILKYVDLVILDLKHSSKKGYKKLVLGDINELYKFKKALDISNTKVWIRHVIIPDITDETNHIKNMNEMINEFKNVVKVELLPYHTLGVHKYKSLNIKYRLKNVTPMCKEKTKLLENLITL